MTRAEKALIRAAIREQDQLRAWKALPIDADTRSPFQRGIAVWHKAHESYRRAVRRVVSERRPS